ncbi:transposase [Nonomuraea indica]|uniref:transposase n=1 Tax=Nonomuraea indica TaxID=1581193 RepID=UPI001182E19B|nr:transposase [Nonomuraea indica]
MRVWRGPDGIEIAVITLDRGHGPRQVYRVVHHSPTRTTVVDYATSVRQIEQWVNLADLVEVIDLPLRRSVA